MPTQYPFPFSTLTYSLNPVFFFLDQQVTLLTSPGTSATNFIITSGSLPSGLSISNVSGTISGVTASLTTVPSIIVISATASDSTTITCQLTINVIDQPLPATQENTATATSLNNIRQLADQAFLSAANQMITNNQALGKFSVTLDLPPHASYSALTQYLQSLGYQTTPLNPSSLPWNTNVGFFNPAEFNFFPDFTPPFPLNRPNLPIRVIVSWGNQPLPMPPYLWANFYPFPSWQ